MLWNPERDFCRRLLWLGVCGVFMLLLPARLHADGGVVRIREQKAPYVVTVFSPSEVASRTPTDISVLLQDSPTGDVITDGIVDITLTAPGGARVASGDPFCSAPAQIHTLGGLTAGSSVTFRASRDHSANKLLYGLPVMLNAPGVWKLRANARRAGEPVTVVCDIPVVDAGGRLAGLWFAFAIPPGAIGLFVLNQRLRRRAGVVALPEPAR
jgi:hypothetical protein